MQSIRTAMVAALAVLVLAPLATTAEAGKRWRMHVLWPKIYSPYITGNIYAEEDEDDNDFLYEEYAIIRERDKRKRIQIYEYAEDDFEPVYEPQRKLRAKPKKKTVASKTAKKPAITTASVAAKNKPVVKSVNGTAQLKSTSQGNTEKTQVASLATGQASSIGCTKGVEIVAGYGFSSIKPKSCTGASYVYDAQRASKAYVIKLTAKTGEIADVQRAQ